MGDTTDKIWAWYNEVLPGIAEQNAKAKAEGRFFTFTHRVHEKDKDAYIDKLLADAEKLMIKEAMTDEPKPDLIDLTGITRTSRGVATHVLVEERGGSHRHIWIKAGECQLQPPDHSDGRPWRFGARFKEGVTDYEHDPPWAFKMGLIGVQLSDID